MEENFIVELQSPYLVCQAGCSAVLSAGERHPFLDYLFEDNFHSEECIKQRFEICRQDMSSKIPGIEFAPKPTRLIVN